MNLQERVDALARVPLFDRVGKKDLERIAATATEREFPAGAIVLNQGEAGVAMFIVASGEAEAVLMQDGKETHLADFTRGSSFGEMALFEHFPRSATVRAKSALSCLALAEWDFQAELRGQPEIAIQLLKVLSRRLREADLEIARLKGEGASVTV